MVIFGLSEKEKLMSLWCLKKRSTSLYNYKSRFWGYSDAISLYQSGFNEPIVPNKVADENKKDHQRGGKNPMSCNKEIINALKNSNMK